MRNFLISAFALACLIASTQPANAQFVFGTVKKDAARILVDYEVQVPKVENVEHSYNVMVPYEEGGVTKMRKEPRTRTVAVTKTVPVTRTLVATSDSHEFLDLAGNKISAEEFRSKATFVLILAADQQITEVHQQVLKEAVLVIKPLSKKSKE